MRDSPFSNAALIGLDWGTTNVRAALLDKSGSVLDERRGESGVGHFSTTEFEKQFDKLVQDWPVLPTIAAGMVGSRQGWTEAGYLNCPTSLSNLSSKLTHLPHLDRTISIVPGLTCRHRMTEHDVMRGEETQIAGYLANYPEFSGTLVLPGTHSKWVRIENGEIAHFQTYMTGDLFNAISKHTILSHSINPQDQNWDDNSFTVAFGDIFHDKGSDWGRLFPIRGDQLILGSEATPNRRERLSGLLIGMEFAASKEDDFDTNSIVLIGDDELVRLYKLGADHLGMKCKSYSNATLIWPALLTLAKCADLLNASKS